MEIAKLAEISRSQLILQQRDSFGQRGEGCESAGPDKHSFAWPPVSIISQRESLIFKKVVNLPAYVCPSWLPHEGPCSCS